MNNLQVKSNQMVSQNWKFKADGKIAANPDFHQYFKPIPLTLYGDSIADLKARQRQFVDESYLGISSDIPVGGGNWCNG